MTTRELSKLSDEQLVAENQKLMRERDRVRGKQLAIKAELDSRHAAREAKRLLEGMTPEQIKSVQAVAASASAKGR